MVPTTPEPGTQNAFKRLERQASSCRICPALANQPAVLSSANGNLNAKIVFVAEAPGRFGAGRTGVPFHGDKSGDNFETLLKYIGLTRSDVFITNAALCNPLANGNNRRPKISEVKNCSPFLKTILDLIRPEIVVTLGSVALQALNLLLGTKYQLKNKVAERLSTPNFTLFLFITQVPASLTGCVLLPNKKKISKKSHIA